MFKNQILRAIVFISLVDCMSASAWASTACPQHFANGVPPIVINPKLQPRTQEICFEAFAVLHSGLSRTPLYSAEHLTRDNLEKAKKLSRRDSFHAEISLPPQDRAELSDYAHSDYDRGHMSPNANFATRSAQAESFSLANMVPQLHANNAGIWASIEGTVRQLAKDEGELYVVTGPAFLGTKIKKIGNVLVPTHLWKIIYSPSKKRAAAYLITNDDTREYSTISASELEKLVGIRLLPGLPQKAQNDILDLPKPISNRKKKNKSQATDEFTMKDFSNQLLNAIEKSIKP